MSRHGVTRWPPKGLWSSRSRARVALAAFAIYAATYAGESILTLFYTHTPQHAEDTPSDNSRQCYPQRRGSAPQSRIATYDPAAFRNEQGHARYDIIRRTMFRYAAVSVAGQNKLIPVATGDAVHHMPPAIAEQHHIANTQHIGITWRQANPRAVTADERTHTVSFCKELRVASFTHLTLHIGKKDLVWDYYLSHDPNIVLHDNRAASASGRHSR